VTRAPPVAVAALGHDRWDDGAVVTAIILLVVLIGIVAGDLALVHALKRRRDRSH
jgi:hypothetical protein